MPIVLHQRPLTPNERDELSGSISRLWLVSLPGVLFRYVLVFLLLMGLVGAVVSILDGMSRKSPAGFSFMQWQPPSWAIPIIIVAIWGPIVLVPIHFATRSLRRNLRRQRARARDREGGYACVARVDDARFISLVSKVGRECLLFEVDPMRGLLIDGERPRFDYALFGLPEPDYDEDEIDDDVPREDDTNRTPFPNSRFDLHWLPHSGRMLHIDVHGGNVAPHRVFLDSELPLPERTSFARGSEREVMLLERSLDSLLATARVAT